MTSLPQAQARPAWWPWLMLAALLAAPVVACAMLDWPPILLPVLVVAALGGLVLLSHTLGGLIFTAFAIVPLGIVQVEVASVTVNLPEALILALAAKETLRFLATDEGPSPMVPWRALLFYLVAAAVAVGTGLISGNGLVAVLQDCRQFVEYVVLYLLVVHRIREPREMVWILAAFVTGGLAVAAHGILQRYTGIGIPGDQLLSDAIFHEGTRSGSFYGATPLGAIMVLSLGPAIGLFLRTRNPAYRLLLLGVIACLLTSAVFTQTRASWLAIALLLGFVLVSIRKSPAVIAAAVAGALVFAALLGPMVAHRMGKLSISKSERSMLERVHYYTAAYHIFREQPVLGLGWGCYYDLKTILTNGRYIPTELPARPNHASPVDATVHSAYLQLLVKAGALGLGAFLLFIASWGLLVLRARRRQPRDDADYVLFVGVAAALLGYLFHSSLENFFQWPVMSQAFWLLMGLSTVMARQLMAEGRLGSTDTADVS